MKDVTSPLEAAVVAKVKDSLSDADPVEIVNIEMDLGLLLKQCFKLAGNNKQNCINIIEPEVFPTGDLGSSEDLLKVDGKFNWPGWISGDLVIMLCSLSNNPTGKTIHFMWQLFQACKHNFKPMNRP